MNRTVPKEILVEFKKILQEASELFQKPLCDVTGLQFAIASNGRLGKHSLTRLGGFAAARDYVAPKTGKSNKDTVAMLERILGK